MHAHHHQPDLAPGLPAGRAPELEGAPWTALTVIVTVMGLLLFMAVPLREPTIRERLAAQREHRAWIARETLSRAVEDYRADHGFWPGVRPSPAGALVPERYDAAVLERQLTQHSDHRGATLPTAEGAHAFGPYLPNGVPPNPTTGLRSFRILDEGERAEHVVDGLYGWIYDPRTGEVQPHRLPFQEHTGSRRQSTRNGLLSR
jgi:hypothetical protein